jgi:hypothetical protein
VRIDFDRRSLLQRHGSLRLHRRSNGSDRRGGWKGQWLSDGVFWLRLVMSLELQY